MNHDQDAHHGFESVAKPNGADQAGIIMAAAGDATTSKAGIRVTVPTPGTSGTSVGSAWP